MGGAHCVGLDITPENIDQAKHHAKAHPEYKIDYVVGSFTELPQEVVDMGPYDVVFSRVSFCHVHEQLDACFAETARVLKPGGRAIINDYIGCDGEVSEDTLENVYKRLHFSHLHGGAKWRQIADKYLTIMQYEDLSAHMTLGYAQLAAAANRQIGLNNCLMIKN